MIAVRPHVEDDIPFIYSTWLRGLYHGNDLFNRIDSETFFSNYHKVLETLLPNPNVSIMVACLKDTPDVVIGYSVSQGNRLHWIFVKKAWRKMGVGRSLLPSGINTVTHLTNVGISLLPKDWKFNPFLEAN